jgi:hypothetical protein
MALRQVVRPAPDLRRECLQHVLRHAERASDIPHGRARAITDDGGAECRAVRTVGIVDPLDHFLPALVLEIHVDIGRLAALFRDEALEEKAAILHRVDRRDPKDETDGAVCSRSPTLAEDRDRQVAGMVDDGIHGEEIGRVFHFLDEPQFVEKLVAHRLRHTFRDSVSAAPSQVYFSSASCGVRCEYSFSSGY